MRDVALGSHNGSLKRRLSLAELVRQHGEMRVEELSALLEVSSVTIRNDLNYLEQQGLIVRRFGKAIAVDQFMEQIFFGDFTHEPPSQSDISQMLGLVHSLISSARSVLISPGPYPKQLIPLLNDFPKRRVLLTDLYAVFLAQQCFYGEINLLGGIVDTESLLCKGPKIIQALLSEIVECHVFQASLCQTGDIIAFGQSADYYQNAVSRAQKNIALIMNYHDEPIYKEQKITLSDLDVLIFASSPHREYYGILKKEGFRSIQTQTSSHVYKRV